MTIQTIKSILGNRIAIRRVPTSDNQILPQPGEIAPADGPDPREPHFEAIVLAVGRNLSEDIKQGDRVICGAHRSQSRVGTRKVIWQGEEAELMSTLDVVAKA